MAERAAHWVDGVIPEVPVRQWVLTLPWSRRLLLTKDHAPCRGVLGLFLEVVFAWYRARLGLPHGQPGAITVIQRFSSSLASSRPRSGPVGRGGAGRHTCGPGSRQRGGFSA